MSTVMGSILRRATRKPGDRINVCSFATHETFQSGLATTNADFYLFGGPNIKNWETKYRPLPRNHHILDKEKGDGQIPIDVDFDCILSQNTFGQYSVARNISRTLHLPLISLCHVLPLNNSQEYIRQIKEMKGHINVFISEYNRDAWGWGADEARVIHHGIDSNLFKPGKKREGRSLSVVNDWIGRRQILGYDMWERVTKGLPTYVLGDSPGLSVPAKSVHELSRAYAESTIFLNTSLVSPIPTSLLESMSAGCCPVSTNNCMIPEIIEHGVNGFLTNDEKEMRQYLQTLLDNPSLAQKLGEAARQTIIEKFSLSKFTEGWDNILEEAAQMTYVGDNL